MATTNKLPLILSLFLGIYLILLLLPGHEAADKLRNKAVPDIAFKTPLGQDTRLSDLRGKVLLLDFWAFWCVPCLEAMPSLRALEERFSPDDFLVLAFHVDGETAGSLSDYIAPGELPRNIIYQLNQQDLEPFQIHALPYTVLVDRKGIVRQTFLGPRHWTSPALLEEIRALVEASP